MVTTNQRQHRHPLNNTGCVFVFVCLCVCVCFPFWHHQFAVYPPRDDIALCRLPSAGRFYHVLRIVCASKCVSVVVYVVCVVCGAIRKQQQESHRCCFTFFQRAWVVVVLCSVSHLKTRVHNTRTHTHHHVVTVTSEYTCLYPHVWCRAGETIFTTTGSNIDVCFC